MSLQEAVAAGDKGKCILNMIRGAETIARELYEQGKFRGVISIGGAQGTEIACAAMRQVPVGVPKLAVSTVASGRATFGPFVGTKDITLMHSVADMQGLNFLTKRILENAAGAICGMMENLEEELMKPERYPGGHVHAGDDNPRCVAMQRDSGEERVLRSSPSTKTVRAASPWRR